LPVLGFDQRVSHAQGVELLGAKAQGLVGRRSRRSSCHILEGPKIMPTACPSVNTP
jgi:hypothetical protein